MATFDLMRKFGIAPDDPKVVIATDAFPRHYKYYAMLVDDRQISTFDSIVGRCFKQVLVGQGRSSIFGREHMSHSVEKRPFRDFVWKRAGLPARPVFTSFNVLFVQKNPTGAENPTRWDNLDQVVDDVKRARPHWNVSSISWLGMPLVEQVRRTHGTNAFVSLPGTDVINGFFLPDNSGLIMPCRFDAHAYEGKGGLHESWEVDAIFSTMPWITTIQFCDGVVTNVGRVMTVDSPTILHVLDSFFESGPIWKGSER